MITLEPVLIVAGCVFLAFALATALDKTHPKRRPNSVFYTLLAISFLFGSRLSDLANGIVALALVMTGGVWGTGRGPAKTTSEPEREASASRYKSVLFV